MSSPNRQYKTSIYEQFSRIGKAISNPSRLELLELLCQAPRTVEVLAREANLGVANTSQHLKALRAARLIEAEKAGLFVTYRLADEAVCQFFRSLRILAEIRLTEVGEITRNFLQGREGMEPIDRKALLARVRRGDVTVLDVRPAGGIQGWAHTGGAFDSAQRTRAASFGPAAGSRCRRLLPRPLLRAGCAGS